MALEGVKPSEMSKDLAGRAEGPRMSAGRLAAGAIRAKPMEIDPRGQRVAKPMRLSVFLAPRSLV